MKGFFIQKKEIILQCENYSNATEFPKKYKPEHREIKRDTPFVALRFSTLLITC